MNTESGGMRNFKLTLLIALFSSTCVWAQTAKSFQSMTEAFDKAVASTSVMEKLYPKLSANTVKELKSWTPEERNGVLQVLKMGIAMGGDEPMKIKESKIGKKQAHITLTSVPKKQGSATMTSTRKADFRKENGQWKTDLGPHLEKMRAFANRRSQ